MYNVMQQDGNGKPYVASGPMDKRQANIFVELASIAWRNMGNRVSTDSRGRVQNKTENTTIWVQEVR